MPGCWRDVVREYNRAPLGFTEIVSPEFDDLFSDLPPTGEGLDHLYQGNPPHEDCQPGAW